MEVFTGIVSDDVPFIRFPDRRYAKFPAFSNKLMEIYDVEAQEFSVGSVQDYISTHQLSDHSVRDVGWITALFVFLTLFLGVQVGPLFDRYGPRHLLMVGCAASFTSYILLAQCSQYWQFMLCLSVLGGLSLAVVTTVSISVLSHWFYRRRAVSSGICMAGSSAGGALIPLALRSLFPKYGWTWSIRIIAFVALGCYSGGIALVKGRLPNGVNNAGESATIDFRAFKSPRLCFLAVSVLAFEFIIFGCAALLPTYVRFAGLPLNVQFYSLTVLNSMSLLGRILSSYVADKFGRFNTLLSLVVVTLVMMSVFWLPFGSRSPATLYAAVAIFGFGSGGWLPLIPVCAGQLCRTEEYGRFYGAIYAVAAFGVLLTVPVGGELLQSTTPPVLVGFYAAVLLGGFISLALSRWALLDWNWRWKIKI